MLRINAIYKILNAAQPGTDFWIISSGLGLNKERAHRLKQAGAMLKTKQIDEKNVPL